MPKIQAIKALKDNYIWAIHSDKDPSKIIMIDPGESVPVLQYLEEYQLTLEGILLTHKHWDHTNGVIDLLKYDSTIPVYGSEIDKVPGITHFVSENEKISFPHFPSPIKILMIPGHTLGHVAYLYQNALFCGDTLFSCGCGKIFEGTSAQMYASLQKLAMLPIYTQIYCGHEYTLGNIAFAQTVDPGNIVLASRKASAEKLISDDKPTLPISLNIELQTNPFLRSKEHAILSSLKNHGYLDKDDPVAAFAFLRELKNNF